MEIEDAKFEKIVLESNIMSLIKDFCKNTGLVVEDIELELRDETVIGDQCVTIRPIIKTKVRL